MEGSDKRKVRRFRLMSITIASVMVFSSLAVISAQLPTASATATGDTYVGSGNWVITNPTVYDGTDVAVTGNIYINGSSLLVNNAKLTLTAGKEIWVNGGTFKISRGNLTSTNTASTTSTCFVGYKNIAGYGVPLYISNSSVVGFEIVPGGSHSYVDNSTLWASNVRDLVATGFADQNVSGNTFNGYTDHSVVYLATTGSFICHNTFSSSVNTTYDSDYPAVITLYGEYSAYSRIEHNDFQNVLWTYGIESYFGRALEISHNHFVQVSDRSAITIYGNQLSEVTTGDWTNIEYNVIDSVRSADSTVHELYGISASWYLSSHVNIRHNSIYDVSRRNPDVDLCGYAVGWGGSYAEITDNYIGNVSGWEDSAAGMSEGIAIHGEDGLSDCYVNVSRNYINSLTRATNGMVFSGRSVGRIDNNTIGEISLMSRGYGVYIADADSGSAHNVDITDNVILDLHKDSCGVIVTHNASDDRVLRNTVHVSSSGSYSAIVDPEEAAILVCGESFVPAAFVGASWTGDGCLVANNTVTNDNPASDSYPEYLIWDAYLTTHGPELRVILNEDSMIDCLNATFTLEDAYGHILTVEGSTTVYDSSHASGAQWQTELDFTDSGDFGEFTRLYANLTTLGGSISSSTASTVQVSDWSISNPENMIWTADSGSAVVTITFTLEGLVNDSMYDVIVNGTLFATIVSNSTGSAQFTYTLTGGSRVFELQTSYLQNAAHLIIQVAMIMVFILIFVGLIGVLIGATSSKKK